MRTYKGTAVISFTAVVPDTLVDIIRKDAQSEATTPFLKAMQEKYPTDDEAFMEAVLKQNTRFHLREAMSNMLVVGGAGGRVAPVEVIIEGIAPKLHDEAPVDPVSLVHPLNPVHDAQGFTDPHGTFDDTPINAVHDPKEQQ